MFFKFLLEGPRRPPHLIPKEDVYLRGLQLLQQSMSPFPAVHCFIGATRRATRFGACSEIPYLSFRSARGHGRPSVADRNTRCNGFPDHVCCAYVRLFVDSRNAAAGILFLLVLVEFSYFFIRHRSRDRWTLWDSAGVSALRPALRCRSEKKFIL